MIAKQVLKNTGFLMGAQVANRILYGILVIFMARALGVEKYGQYAFAISFAGLFMMLSDVGLDVFLVREIARFRERVNEILANAVVLKTTLALTAIAFALATIEILHYSRDIIWAVLILAIACGLKSICSTLWTLFRGFEQMELEGFSDSHRA